MTAPLLALDKVSVRYASRRVAAVEDVSISIETGRTLGIVGESGCGKSTLAKAVMGLVPVGAGSLHFLGQDITRMTPSRRLQARIGMQIVFQDPQSSLDPRMRVRDLITEPLVIAGRPSAGVAESLADQVGLPQDALGSRPHEFSGGQRQRIAIARAILKNPPLLLLDEATSALDAESERAVQGALEALMHTRTTLIIAHRLATVLKADRIIVMDQGKIVASGRHEELIASNPLYARLAALQFTDGAGA